MKFLNRNRKRHTKKYNSEKLPSLGLELLITKEQLSGHIHIHKSQSIYDKNKENKESKLAKDAKKIQQPPTDEKIKGTKHKSIMYQNIKYGRARQSLIQLKPTYSNSTAKKRNLK
jgi:hypothetical protein